MLFACFHVVPCRGLLHVRIHTAALYYVHTSPCVLGDTLLNPAHTHRSVVRFSFVVDCFVKLIHLAHTQSAYCSSMKSYLNYAMRFQMRMNGSHGCDGKSAYHQWMLISSLVAQCVATMNVVHPFLSLSLSDSLDCHFGLDKLEQIQWFRNCMPIIFGVREQKPNI